MDYIEKKILLKAPVSKVWTALTDSAQFGRWFGARFEGPFVTGQRLRGKIVGTEMNAEVAAMQKPYENKPFEITIERIEPERLFSFRWHPHAVDLTTDYSKEPTTLIEFTLEPSEGGTLLRVKESGFENIPLERRASALKANEGGWEIQMKLIEAYLAQTK
jgi:uncharacterized protein YndB with AHSA1/START domain